MFYDPAISMKPAPFAYSPFKSLIVPRPIGWIGTISADGIPNLAPYSFFNGVSDDPPCVLFCPNGDHSEGGPKDTLKNVAETGEFVYNLVGYDHADAMNVTASSVPRATDEAELAGLETAPCNKISVPRLAQAASSFECKHLMTVDLPVGPNGSKNCVVIGQVIGIHVRDDVITEAGLIDIQKIRPLARLGYKDYTSVTEIFSMERPA